jgi:hypothetical protein
MDELRNQIDRKLQKLGGNYYPASHPSLAIQDRENVPILESIFSILKSFDERLKKLEDPNSKWAADSSERPST